MKTAFSIHGEPQGKGRPRFSVINGHANARTPDKTVIYENLVRMEYRRQCGDARFPDDAVLRMEILAVFAIPASASKAKKQRMENGELRPTKKPDMDNIVKVIADSLNGIAYRDDAQIVDCGISKRYGDVPRVEVQITDGRNA